MSVCRYSQHKYRTTAFPSSCGTACRPVPSSTWAARSRSVRKVAATEDFLNGLLRYQALATKDLQSLMGHLKGVLGTGDLGGHGHLHGWHWLGVVVDQCPTGQGAGRLDLAVHMKQPVSHTLMAN